MKIKRLLVLLLLTLAIAVSLSSCDLSGFLSGDNGDDTGDNGGGNEGGNNGGDTGNNGGNTGDNGGNNSSNGGNTGDNGVNTEGSGGNTGSGGGSTDEGGNTGNEGGNTGNEGGNTGNEGGNTGNEGGNTGNEGGNTGNEGGEPGFEGGNEGEDSGTGSVDKVGLTFGGEDELNYFELTTIYSNAGISSNEPAGEKDVQLKLDNGALVLESPIYHRNIIELRRTKDATGVKAIFEADITIDVGSLGAGPASVNFVFYNSSVSTNQSPARFTPFYIKLADGATSATITNEAQTARVTELIKDNVKFTLRLEYLINPYGYNNTNIYIKPEGAIDFETMGRSTISASTSAPSPDDISFFIETERQSDVKITLDNLFFESRSADDMPGDITAGNTGDDNKAMEEVIANGAAVLDVKGGADGIVVLIHDDSGVTAGKNLDALFEKYSIVGDVGMIVNTIYDVSTGNTKSSYLEWKALLENGRWGIVNHSMTHGFWGTADGTLVIDHNKITSEVVTSGEILRQLFPGHRILTFAYPGHDGLVNRFGDDVYAAIKEVVDENYIAGRHYNGEAKKFYSWADWNWMPAQSIGDGYLNTTLTTIDSAAKGRFATIFVHHVVTDEIYNSAYKDKGYGNTYVPVSHMEAICEKISGYAKDGKIWNAHYEDAILYLRESENAEVSVSENNGIIELTLTDGLDNSIYNYPLTVRVKVNSSWEAVKIEQNGKCSYAVVKTIDGVPVIDADIVPDAGVATITSITLDEIEQGGGGADGNEDSPEGSGTTGSGGPLDFDGNGSIDNGAWTKPDAE